MADGTMKRRVGKTWAALRMVGRVLLAAIGVFLAGFMTIAAAAEARADDFFGTSVCMLVLVFGIELIALATRRGRGPEAPPNGPDPLRDFWRVDRAYPIRHASRYRTHHRR